MNTRKFLFWWTLPALVVIVGFAFLSFQLGWFVKEKTVDRQTNLNRRSTGFQRGAIDRAREYVLNAETAPTPEHAVAFTTRACTVIADIITLPPDLAKFQVTSC